MSLSLSSLNISRRGCAPARQRRIRQLRDVESRASRQISDVNSVGPLDGGVAHWTPCEVKFVMWLCAQLIQGSQTGSVCGRSVISSMEKDVETQEHEHDSFSSAFFEWITALIRQCFQSHFNGSSYPQTFLARRCCGCPQETVFSGGNLRGHGLAALRFKRTFFSSSVSSWRQKPADLD